MQIHVRLVGVFCIGRFKEKPCEYPTGTKVQDVIRHLQLSEQILGLPLLNGEHTGFDAVLHEGDRLTILPILDGG